MTFNNYSTKQYLKVVLLLLAMAIGLFSLHYSNKMVKKLSLEERKKISQWAEAQELIAKSDPEQDITFYVSIVDSNSTIPVFLADESGFISYRNIDSSIIKNKKKLNAYYEDLKAETQPIEIKITDEYSQYVYYDESSTLKQLKFYPFVQLGIVSLFVVVSYFAFSYSRKSEQNQVWVGLAKETAHQLGTPMSSLMAWVDLIDSDRSFANTESLAEMRKDLDRLKVITDRFSKIGSTPILNKVDIGVQLLHAVEYMKKRSSEEVEFDTSGIHKGIMANINEPLFEWVVENICKNAIDAMDGKGKITVSCRMKGQFVLVEITDNGKGLPKALFKRIFKPGFTTKKRGWGLGLSLVKRIIENYHKGHIFVKESIPNKKTTFRIALKQI
jgi:nitrogen fixation/metabolism regulation signal transduction histidine kinase